MSIDVSALTPQEQVTAIYVAYYDRASDPAGLQFWVSKITSGEMTLTEVANAFANAAETKAKYTYFEAPDVAGVATFINEIYQNLFNRAPDAEGATFWADQLTSGAVAAGEFILAVLAGAQDVEGGTQDKSVVENKIEVAFDWAQSALAEGVGTSGNPIAQEVDGKLEVLDQDAFDSATSILDGVTGDAASVDAAKAATDAFFSAVDPFNLTTATDTFTGTDADDVFNAPLAPAIDGLLGAQTLQGTDVLDGGEGVNTLNAELNQTGITQNPEISNIQVYNLTSLGGLLGGGANLDLDRAGDYEQLWNQDSRFDLTLDNVGEVAVLGMDNVRDGSEYDVNYDNIDVAEQTVVAMMSGRPGDAVTLDIDGVDGAIGTFTLLVSDDNYLFLDSDAADMENLVISGSGILELEGEDDFDNLETLDATGYDGDLLLDVSGSGDLMSILTGPGDDRIIVDNDVVDGGLSGDMGAGANTLAIEGVANETQINALDFSGGIAHVQTLAFVDGISSTGNAVLDLNGLSELTTINFESFVDFFHDFGAVKTINSAPTDLAINVLAGSETLGVNINGTENLSIGGTDALFTDNFGAPPAAFNGASALQGANLVNIDADVSGDLVIEMSANVGNLETLSAVAGASSTVFLESDGTELESLRTVNVRGDNANLTMTGAAGQAFFAGTQATQSFTINVTPNSGLVIGNVFFTSGSLGAGFVNTAYNASSIFGNNDAFAANDIAADLDATPELIATSGLFSNVVNVTWADVGVVDPLVFQSGASGATSGTLNSVTPGLFTQGQELIPFEEGEGFEALETVTVEAVDGNANVNLTDVYGAFMLDVDASNDANVILTNTNVTSAMVTAGNFAGVTIGGDTIGAWSLVDLTVDADTANVDLNDDMGSFTTLDVSAVATNLEVDTFDAIFDVAPGEFIDYLIGATDDGTNAVDVTFTGNDAREVYDFVGGDIGEVVINNFDVSADITDPGDRLDLSGFAGSAGELVFTDNGFDIVITDLNGGLGDFGGSITIVGAAGFANEIASFNIIYG